MEPEYKALAIGISIGVVVSFVLYLTFGFDLIYFLLWVVITTAAGVSPYSFIKHIEHKRIKNIEEKFPSFLRDVAESIRAGMTIPNSISAVSKTKYGPLSEEIIKLNTTLSWGTPFQEAIRMFQKRLAKSEFVKRGVSILMQAHYTGGKTAEAMDSIAESTVLLQEIEKDRESILKEQLIVLYVVQFLFSGIMVAVYKILIPLLTATSGTGFFLQIAQAPPIEYYKLLMFLAITVQSFCNGIIAGEAREGSTVSGFKHSGIMLACGLTLFIIFIMPINFEIIASVSSKIAVPLQPLTITGEVMLENKILPSINVTITTPQKTEIVTTDMMGEFTLEFVSPSKVGLYEIKFETTYQKHTTEKKLQFVVR